MKKNIIEFHQVSKTFPDGREVLKDFSLSIEQGEIFVLLGKSGIGKTTAMKMINGLETPSSGEVLVCDACIQQQDMIQLRRNIGFAPQGDTLFPHMTVAENLELAYVSQQTKETLQTGSSPFVSFYEKCGLDDRLLPRLLSSLEFKEMVLDLLSMLELDAEEILSRYPNELSGGQKQRIIVARALVSDPPILLMDEPFSAVDPMNRASIQSRFKKLQKEKQKTVILVTHDLHEAVMMGDRIALIEEGNSIHINTPEMLLEDVNNDFLNQYLGDHRFHLVLQATKLSDILSSRHKHEKREQELPCVSVDDSILRALSLFNKRPVETIFVEQRTGMGHPLSRLDFTQSLIALIFKHLNSHV